MNLRKIYFVIFLVCTMLSLVLLVTGSPILTIGIGANNEVPLGTFITWVGLISLPATIFFGSKELRKPNTKWNKVLAFSLKIFLILALLWIPISFLLAGNLSFSFSERETFRGGQLAMKLFWRLSYGIGIGSITVLLLYWVISFLKKK